MDLQRTFYDTLTIMIQESSPPFPESLDKYASDGVILENAKAMLFKIYP